MASAKTLTENPDVIEGIYAQHAASILEKAVLLAEGVEEDASAPHSATLGGHADDDVDADLEAV